MSNTFEDVSDVKVVYVFTGNRIIERKVLFGESLNKKPKKK